MTQIKMIVCVEKIHTTTQWNFTGRKEKRTYKMYTNMCTKYKSLSVKSCPTRTLI